MKTIYQVGWLLSTFFLTIFVITYNQDCQVMANVWIPIYFILMVLSFFLGEYAGKVEMLKRYERSDKWN